MIEVQLGDRVQVQYVRIAGPGVMADTTVGQKNCEFTVGGTEVLPALSTGVIGMTPGHHKRLTIQPAEAHGHVQRRLIRKIPRARFPAHMVLEVGKRLSMKGKTAGRRRRVRIVEVKFDSVLVDGNHPLAGKVIELDVLLLSLVSFELSPNSSQGAERIDPSTTN
jgi:FKBP-type peptidyl-prolyl cis-trans isomerase 2